MYKRIFNVLVIFLCLLAVKNVVYGYMTSEEIYNAILTYKDKNPAMLSDDQIVYYIDSDFFYNGGKNLKKLLEDNRELLESWMSKLTDTSEKYEKNFLEDLLERIDGAWPLSTGNALREKINYDLLDCEKTLVKDKKLDEEEAMYRWYSRASMFLPVIHVSSSYRDVAQLVLCITATLDQSDGNLSELMVNLGKSSEKYNIGNEGLQSKYSTMICNFIDTEGGSQLLENVWEGTYLADEYVEPNEYGEEGLRWSLERYLYKQTGCKLNIVRYQKS